MSDVVIERSIDLPFGYAFSVRARPSSVRSTVLKLLPWAVVFAFPRGGTASRFAIMAASRVSPLMKQTLG
jgi:hypothetical protein